MNWYVYMLLCRTGGDRTSIYTGITTDVARRFVEHVNGKGAKFTKANKPMMILLKEGPCGESEARRREYEIKQMTRKQKERLVGGCW